MNRYEAVGLEDLPWWFVYGLGVLMGIPIGTILTRWLW